MAVSKLQAKAQNFDDEVKFTLKKIKSKMAEKLIVSFGRTDASFAHHTIVEAMNWRRVSLDNISLAVYKEMFSRNLVKIPKPIKKRDHMLYEHYFFTGEEWRSFLQNLLGFRDLRFDETSGEDISTIFVYPYGTVTKSFTPTSHTYLNGIFVTKGWKPAYVDTAISPGNLQCDYNGLKASMCFVLDEFSIFVGSKKEYFFKILVPCSNGVGCTHCKLMRNVSIAGFMGVIPGECVKQRNARLPYVRYKAYSRALGHLVMGFRPFQSINHQLQWMTRTLSSRVAAEADVDESATLLVIPTGFERFTGDMTEQFINDGDLVDLHIMFKLYEDEWKAMKVIAFIDPNCRDPVHGYMYRARFLGSNITMMFVFKLEMYDWNASENSALATWFVLNKL